MAKRKTTDQVQINVRMREVLRAKLEQSAKKNYESLNREIVDRLERSFDRQDLLIEALTLAYGGQVAGRLMMIGRAMQEAGRMAAAAANPRTSPDQWVRNAFAYRQAMEAVMMVLFDLRPEGDPAAPKTTWLPEDYKVELIGTYTAKMLTEAVKGKASPELRKFAVTVRALLNEEDPE
jgi:hypothetical protein